MAAVISGPVIMHTYLVAHVASSTISELTLWSSGPPQVPWPSMADNQVLDAMTDAIVRCLYRLVPVSRLVGSCRR